MTVFVQGSPCLKCGGTKRYANSHACATCRRVLTLEQKIAAKQRQKKWKENNRERHLRHRRISRFKIYGLNEAQYDALLFAQGHACPCCGVALAADKNTHIDHDHVTGKVRGLLCQSCNLAIGIVKESVETLLRLGIYLEKHRG